MEEILFHSRLDPVQYHSNNVFFKIILTTCFDLYQYTAIIVQCCVQKSKNNGIVRRVARRNYVW